MLELSRTSGIASSGPQAGDNYCWSYDPVGNRTAEYVGTTACPTPETSVTPTASYDSHNQVTWAANTAPTGYTYDAAGNVLSDGVNRYLYDGEGRLCAYQNVAVAGNYGPMMGYVYGPDGLRVGKGTITTWTCNPLTAGFAMTASYVLGPGGEQVSEMAVTGTYGNYSSSWQHTNVFADGRLLATYNGTETYFALSDWLGTKRAEITPDGQSARFFQLPYGNGLTSNGSLADATEQHFTGKERDPETGEANGNDYFGARYYASSMGRFFSPDDGSDQDPTDPQSWNLYAYVRNNPLINTDPDGHGCQTSTYIGIWDGKVTQTESSSDRSDCAYFSGLLDLLTHAANQTANAASQIVNHVSNIMSTPGGAKCLAERTIGGGLAGAGTGAAIGSAGIVTGPGVLGTEAAGVTIGTGIGLGGGAAFAMATCPGGSGGSVGGAPKKWQITSPADKKIIGGRTYLKDAKTGLWWSRDTAGHGGSAWKVFEEVPGGLRWIEDADEQGNYIRGKWKSPTGMFVRF